MPRAATAGTTLLHRCSEPIAAASPLLRWRVYTADRPVCALHLHLHCYPCLLPVPTPLPACIGRLLSIPYRCLRLPLAKNDGADGTGLNRDGRRGHCMPGCRRWRRWRSALCATTRSGAGSLCAAATYAPSSSVSTRPGTGDMRRTCHWSLQHHLVSAARRAGTVTGDILPHRPTCTAACSAPCSRRVCISAGYWAGRGWLRRGRSPLPPPAACLTWTNGQENALPISPYACGGYLLLLLSLYSLFWTATRCLLPLNTLTRSATSVYTLLYIACVYSSFLSCWLTAHSAHNRFKCICSSRRLELLSARCSPATRRRLRVLPVSRITRVRNVPPRLLRGSSMFALGTGAPLFCLQRRNGMAAWRFFLRRALAYNLPGRATTSCHL